MSSREGIEIDFCPQCRGVWLDRGELDKIIERAASTLAPTGGGRATAGGPEREPRYEDRRYEDRRSDDRRYDDNSGHHKRKKRSFLENLFESD